MITKVMCIAFNLCCYEQQLQVITTLLRRWLFNKRIYQGQGSQIPFINECELQCLFMFLLDHEKQHGRMNGWDSAK